MSHTNQPQPESFRRCYELVGRFFFEFNLMEASMDWAIGAALDVDNDTALVVGANVELYRKIYILKTAVAVSTLSDREKRRFERYLNIISDVNIVRNKLAHHPFAPDNNGIGLEIYISEAKGSLSKRTELCSTQKMGSEYRRIERCRAQIDALSKALKRVKSTQKLVDALLRAPNPYTAPLSFFGSQLPPVPGLLSSHPPSATDETSPRNDDDPSS